MAATSGPAGAVPIGRPASRCEQGETGHIYSREKLQYGVHFIRSIGPRFDAGPTNCINGSGRMLPRRKARGRGRAWAQMRSPEGVRPSEKDVTWVPESRWVAATCHLSRDGDSPAALPAAWMCCYCSIEKFGTTGSRLSIVPGCDIFVNG